MDNLVKIYKYLMNVPNF